MFTFAGLRGCFQSLQIDGNDSAGLYVFRLKVAPAVGLDFIRTRGEARAIQLQRPGLAGEPDIEFGGNRSVLRAGRSLQEQCDGQNEVASGLHVKLRNGSLLFTLRGNKLQMWNQEFRLSK